jgi:hypothetical protein
MKTMKGSLRNGSAEIRGVGMETNVWTLVWPRYFAGPQQGDLRCAGEWRTNLGIRTLYRESDSVFHHNVFKK